MHLSRDLPALSWMEVELVAEKQDSDPVVSQVAEASSVGLDYLDYGVHSIGDRVGDPMAQVGQDVFQLGHDHAGHPIGRRQETAGRPLVVSPLLGQKPKRKIPWGRGNASPRSDQRTLVIHKKAGIIRFWLRHCQAEDFTKISF